MESRYNIHCASRCSLGVEINDERWITASSRARKAGKMPFGMESVLAMGKCVISSVVNKSVSKQRTSFRKTKKASGFGAITIGNATDTDDAAAVSKISSVQNGLVLRYPTAVWLVPSFGESGCE